VSAHALEVLSDVAKTHHASQDCSSRCFLSWIQKSQDEINSFLKRKQDEVSERAANLEKMQLQFMAEVCLATAHAKKLHSRENVQPPDFLDRSQFASDRQTGVVRVYLYV
jgi:hypothetical protein